MKRIVKLAAIGIMVAGMASVANAERFVGHGYGGYGRGSSFGLRVGNVGISIGTPRYTTRRYSPRIGPAIGHGIGHAAGYGYGVGGGFGHHGSHATWHDTSHYDYHGPSLIPHGNHYDRVPGHYDLHRTGHWDVHH